jgi:glycosyltransferase involved in cell wall biosynthesis
MHTTLEHNAGREGWFLKEIIPQYNVVDKLLISKNAGPVSGVPERVVRMTYNISDVFVSATECEGFGLPFLEAAACGKPSIGVNYSSIPELIKGRGELVDPSDWVHAKPNGMCRPLISIKKLAGKMNKLYRDRDLCKQYGDKGLEFAQTMTWDRILPRFGDLIEDALEYNEKRSKEPVKFIEPETVSVEV